MRCYAKWFVDNDAGVAFRDQTILQFGDEWGLLASLVLLNPGSAMPLSAESMTNVLRARELPYFVEPDAGEEYFEFSIDPLMRNVLKAVSNKYSGGVVKIYNLYNIKNQHSSESINQLKNLSEHPKTFTKNTDIKL